MMLPQYLKKYGASDLATGTEEGDFTEHGVVGMDQHENLFVLDWWFGQRDTNESGDAFIDMSLRHNPVAWAQEMGPIWKATKPFWTKKMQERSCFQYIVELPSVGDKEMRAASIQGRMSQLKVFFPEDAPWRKRLELQMLKFPKGKLDDGVDVMSLLGRLIHKMKGEVPPPKKEEPKFENSFKLPSLEDDLEDL